MSAITNVPHSGAGLFTASDINTTVNCEPRIEDVRLAQALGFKRPRDIRKLIERSKTELERFATCATVAHVVRGNPSTTYYLTEKQAIYLCTKSEAEKAVEVTIQMVEVFYQYRHGVTTPVSPPLALPSPERPTHYDAAAQVNAKIIDALIAVEAMEAIGINQTHAGWLLRLCEKEAKEALQDARERVEADLLDPKLTRMLADLRAR